MAEFAAKYQYIPILMYFLLDLLFLILNLNLVYLNIKEILLWLNPVIEQANSGLL
jgi:hypothetical protein